MICVMICVIIRENMCVQLCFLCVLTTTKISYHPEGGLLDNNNDNWNWDRFGVDFDRGFVVLWLCCGCVVVVVGKVRVRTCCGEGGVSAGVK